MLNLADINRFQNDPVSKERKFFLQPHFSTLNLSFMVLNIYIYKRRYDEQIQLKNSDKKILNHKIMSSK